MDYKLFLKEYFYCLQTLVGQKVSLRRLLLYSNFCLLQTFLREIIIVRISSSFCLSSCNIFLFSQTRTICWCCYHQNEEKIIKPSWIIFLLASQPEQMMTYWENFISFKIFSSATNNQFFNIKVQQNIEEVQIFLPLISLVFCPLIFLVFSATQFLTLQSWSIEHK